LIYYKYDVLYTFNGKKENIGGIKICHFIAAAKA